MSIAWRPDNGHAARARSVHAAWRMIVGAAVAAPANELRRVFTARRYAIAVYTVNVCLSHSGIVSKRSRK